MKWKEWRRTWNLSWTNFLLKRRKRGRLSLRKKNITKELVHSDMVKIGSVAIERKTIDSTRKM